MSGIPGVDCRLAIGRERRAGEILGSPDACLWRHEAPEHEPLLWIADAVASAYGAGGEWRQLVEPLVKEVWLLDDPQIS